MISRFKPYLGKEELLAAFRPEKNAVELFEDEFARAFEAKHALAFSYGRSALWALFEALDIKNAEVVMPAYTCAVVAHAIVLSGNMPRFVDITLHDYNMDLDLMSEAINENTRAIIATHLFGYPLDVNLLAEIVRFAENRFGHKIWIFQDCAHSFGAEWKGKLVCNAGDAALFGLNIIKMMTSIFGGMITTNDKELFDKLKTYRDSHFKEPGFGRTIRRLLYILAVYPAFNEQIYGLVYWLQEKTTILNRLTKAYHLDDKIRFPPDHIDRMLPIEAKVGLEQLKKYPEIIKRRRETAAFYDKNLSSRDGWIKPPLVEGATYSHYVPRCRNRDKLVERAFKSGIEFGKLIDYVIADTAPYRKYATEEYPMARSALRHVVNLPVYVSLTNIEKARIVDVLLNYGTI